jgi:hypothetical protein
MKWEKSMVMENLIGQMVLPMKENSLIIMYIYLKTEMKIKLLNIKRYMVKVHMNGLMVENMLEIGKIIKCKIYFQIYFFNLF